MPSPVWRESGNTNVIDPFLMLAPQSKRIFIRRAGIFLMVSTVAFAAWAAGIKHSAAIQGIFAEFIIDDSDSVPSTQKIIYGFLRADEQPKAILIPKRDFLCELELVNTNGVKFPRTTLGKSFGSRFRELTNFSYDAVEKVPANGSNSEHTRVVYLEKDSYAG